MLNTILALDTLDHATTVYGNLASGLGLLGAAIGVGLVGFRAVEAVGRNPGASGKILVQSILAMALCEGLGVLALFLAK